MVIPHIMCSYLTGHNKKIIIQDCAQDVTILHYQCLSPRYHNWMRNIKWATLPWCKRILLVILIEHVLLFPICFIGPIRNSIFIRPFSHGYPSIHRKSQWQFSLLWLDVVWWLWCSWMNHFTWHSRIDGAINRGMRPTFGCCARKTWIIDKLIKFKSIHLSFKLNFADQRRRLLGCTDNLSLDRNHFHGTHWLRIMK